MSKIIIPLFFVFVLLSEKADAWGDPRISLEIRERGENQYELFCHSEQQLIGSFSIRAVFPQMVNIKLPDVIVAVTTPESVIRTLVPEDPQKNWQIGIYSYWFIRGKYNTKPERDFVYRVPVSAQKKNIQIRTASGNVNRIPRNNGAEEVPEEVGPWVFLLSQGDTIYAARKGTVVEIEEEELQGDILIEHADGTLARYSLLQPGSLMVKVGDRVYPDTPLALAGTYNGKVYQFGFGLCHTVLGDAELMVRDIRYAFKQVYLDPLFLTTEGIVKLVSEQCYTPVVNDDLIRKEMSKREISKRKN